MSTNTDTTPDTTPDEDDTSCAAPKLTGIETVADLLAADTGGDGHPRDTALPEDIRHDNLRRAGRAALALGAFADSPNDPPEKVMTDLLGDLYHLADALDLNIAVLDSTAYDLYIEERSGRV